MDHMIYNSHEQSDYITINAPYYNAIRPTKITFEQEQINVLVDSLGHVEFQDLQGTCLGYIDSPAAKSPDLYGHSGQYGTVWCKVQDNKIIVRLPIYTWYDDYPHCDGEYDRWSRCTVGHFHVTFDLTSQKIAYEKPKETT